MTINPPIEPTPARQGGNVAIGERELGRRARAVLKDIDKLHGRHADVVAAIHEKILDFGRILIAGKEINPRTQDFKHWCEREGITEDKHKFGHPVTRSQAMQIARLHDIGIDPLQLDQDVDEADLMKLSLAGCTMITPAEILKWGATGLIRSASRSRRQAGRGGKEARAEEARGEARRG